MRVFKIILKVFLVLVFIVSVLFNILFFGSSYGSLVVKYNKDTFSSLVSLNTYEYLLEIDNGMIFTIEDNSSKVSYYFYANKEDKLNMKAVSTNKKDGKTSTSYYTEGYLYTEDSEGNKTKQVYTDDLITTNYLKIYNDKYNSEDLLDYIELSDDKTSIHFSFSPFYVLGIDYQMKSENETTTYYYDLNGNLRSVVFENKADSTKNYEMTITHKAKDISFPNFDDYK